MHRLVAVALAGLFLGTFAFAQESGETFSLTKKEAAAASLDAESAELSADAVATGDDLQRFATSRMKRDAGLERIEVSEAEVRVEYRQKARFLWVIPAGIRAAAEASGDGTAEVDYPWYRFLFSVDTTDETVLQARVGEAAGGATFDAGTKARLINALHNALRGPQEA